MYLVDGTHEYALEFVALVLLLQDVLFAYVVVELVLEEEGMEA